MISIAELTDFLRDKISGLRLIVIGDLMLDCYYYGNVARISPEAPVPVNNVTREAANLGGAGNVAANLAGLGAQVRMCSALGQDEYGLRLSSLLADQYIGQSGVIRTAGRKTTGKLRVIGANQQMLRLDFEEIKQLTVAEETALAAWLEQEIGENTDGIIISDYAKGVCTPGLCQTAIRSAARFNIPVLVDPKGYAWTKYRGADFITPNVKELGEALQKHVDNVTAAVTGAAREALARYEVKSVLATRSELGMTFVSGQDTFTEAASAREIYDVSGAGDTVAAVFLCAIAGGLSPAGAVYLANQAAGIVVGRAGAYAVRRDELLAELLDKESKATRDRRALNQEEAGRLVDKWRRAGETVVFTNGCFDILHTGHIDYLEKAARLGTRLIIGLNSDTSVRKLKGPARPLVGEQDRARILTALAFVDAVVLFAQETPAELIKQLRPDILVKGGDYRPEQVAGREYAREVKIIDFVAGYSTTGLIGKIANLVKEGIL